MFEIIDRFVSVIGKGLIEPIITLFEKPESFSVKDRESEVQPRKKCLALLKILPQVGSFNTVAIKVKDE